MSNEFAEANSFWKFPKGSSEISFPENFREYGFNKINKRIGLGC